MQAFLHHFYVGASGWLAHSQCPYLALPASSISQVRGEEWGRSEKAPVSGSSVPSEHYNSHDSREDPSVSLQDLFQFHTGLGVPF